MLGNLVAVLNEPVSERECYDFVKTAFDFTQTSVVLCNKNLDLEKTINYLHKMAYKTGRSFLVVGEVNDAITLFKPEKIVCIQPKSKKAFSADATGTDLQDKKTVMLVFGKPIDKLKDGGAQETEVETVSLAMNMATASAAAVVLYEIYSLTQKNAWQ